MALTGAARFLRLVGVWGGGVREEEEEEGGSTWGGGGRRPPHTRTGVGNARLVGAHCGAVAAVVVGHVGGQVGQAVGLNDGNDGHPALVLPQQRRQGVNVGALVLGNARSAVPAGVVVARAVCIVGAADLAIGGLGVAVAVGQVVHDQHHRLRRLLAGGVGKNARHGHAVVGVPGNLGRGVHPEGRRHAAHELEVGAGGGVSARGNGGRDLGHKGRVDVKGLASKGVARGGSRGSGGSRQGGQCGQGHAVTAVTAQRERRQIA